MQSLPKKYKANESESKWQEQWEQAGTYRWESDQPRENTYVIDTPPPTVSGTLHMGHIFSYTQADIIARYQRMKGKTVFYPIGFDDNGLPTERLVEKKIKKRAIDLSREEFIEQCMRVSEEARAEFKSLFQSMGMSFDWNEEYHTISEHSRRTSQMSFLDLYEKELAYRQLQPMLWDPVDQTAIAQAEVEEKEVDTFENYIYFGLMEEGAAPADANWESLEKVEIMTTRPELLAACVALMCHPDDAAKYAGKVAVTPIFNVIVPIVADEKVDKEKGTGLVMCCTFGDETDIEWWKTHKLETRVILNNYGKISDQVSRIGTDEWKALNSEAARTIASELKGLKARTTAREKMVELLTNADCYAKDGESGAIKRKKKSHMEPCAERSGAALEIMPTPQWFVKILDYKDELKAKAAECAWNPPHMKVRMDQWIDGLSWDWCISRQRYFGVPFPVWYSKRAGEEGKILLADVDQLPVNPLTDLPKGYSKEEVEPDLDVMDTWATSSVSPQISSHGISENFMLDKDRHSRLFPADLRPQAHEIIRTWAFYTLVKAFHHENTRPWHRLMISGWCLASDKTKMSKSKGNVVDPVGLINLHGADAVRYWTSTSKLGNDIALSEDVIKIGKKLVTKLWNASKFVAMNLAALEGRPSDAVADVREGRISESLDKWILSRLNQCIKNATQAFDEYEYSNARSYIEDFFWNDLCDNYLELCKARAYGENEVFTPAQRQSALRTLYYCLEAVLRLFSPIVPHITEEIYSHLFEDAYKANGSIHARGRWPAADAYPYDESAEQTGEAAVIVLSAVRKIKAEQEISIKYPVEQLNVAVKEGGVSAEALASTENDLLTTTSAAQLSFEGASLAVSTTLEGNPPYEVSLTLAERAEVA